MAAIEVALVIARMFGRQVANSMLPLGCARRAGGTALGVALGLGNVRYRYTALREFRDRFCRRWNAANVNCHVAPSFLVL